MIIKEFLVSLGAKVDLTAMEKGLRSADRMAAQFGKSWIAQFAAAGAAVTALSITASAGVVKLAGGLEKVAPEVKALQNTLKDSTEWIRKYLQENLSVPLKWIRKSLKDGHEGFQKNKEKILKGIGDLMLGVVRFAATVIRGATDVGRVIGRVLKAIPPEIALIGGALAVLGLILKTGPLGIAMAIFTALILLLDDFYTYMDGGKSLFGDKWKVVIEWGEKIKKFLGDTKERFDDLRKKVSKWWEEFKISPSAQAFMDGLGKFLETARDSAVKLKNGWKDLVDRMEDNGVIGDLGGLLSELAGTLADVAGEALGAAEALLDLLFVDTDNNGLADFSEFLNVTLIPALQVAFDLIRGIMELTGLASDVVFGMGGGFIARDSEKIDQSAKSAEKRIWRLLTLGTGRVVESFEDYKKAWTDAAQGKPPTSTPATFAGSESATSSSRANQDTSTSNTSLAAIKPTGRLSKQTGSVRSIAESGANPVTAAANTQSSAGSTTQTNRAAASANAQKSTGTTRAFAEGGVVQRPTYALIGEEGPEVVINPKKPNALTLIMQALQMPGLKQALDTGRRNLEMVNNAPAYMYQQIAYQNLAQNTYNMNQQHQGARHEQTDAQNTANSQTHVRSEEKNISLTVNNTTNVYGSGDAKEAAGAVNKNNNTTLIRNIRGVLA